MFWNRTLWLIPPFFCLFGAIILRDHHIRLFAGLEGFSKRQTFALMDSLPALSGGLGELEAFKVTADASAKSNMDRSVWLSDSLINISVEYYSGRSRFDSTTFYLWTNEFPLQSRTLKGSREFKWNVEYGKRIRNWTEVVGVYVTRPRFLELRTTDTAVSVFERIEGKSLHVVKRRYRARKESIARPDTAYPANNAGELELLAKGSSLAIVNPTDDLVRLRVIRINENTWDNVLVQSRSIHVYRNLLHGNSGPLLAYTDPGKPFLILFKKNLKPASYFWLDRKKP